MAQSNVYSLNVVGYVNLTVGVGYNLISLPLQSSDVTSSINSVLTNSAPAAIPFGAQELSWNPSTSKYYQPQLAGGDGNWYTDGNFDVFSTNSLPPGNAFFLFIPTVANQITGNGYGYSNYTITVVGTVLQGTNTTSVNTGYGFYGNFEPVAGDLTTNGFPVSDNDQLTTWTPAGGYSQPLIGLGTDDSGYDSMGNLTGNPSTYPVFTTPAELVRVVFTPAVGQGFVYLRLTAGSAAWTQTFTVQ
jgi:hypothetical protein